MDPSSQKVLINGGGLAGFALAIALARANISSTVFETRDHPATVGGAIALAPNGLRILDKTIAVYDIIRPLGYEFEEMHLIFDDGLQIGTAVNGSVEKYGYKALRIMRSAVHNALVDCAKTFPQKISIRWDNSIDKIKELDDGVEVTLRNGESMQGTIVVGADGIHSKVREHVLGDEAPTPVYQGNFGVGGAVTYGDIEWGSVTLPALVYSQKGNLIAMPVNQSGDRVNWAIQRTIPEKTREGWDDYITSGQALRDARAQFEPEPPQLIRDIIDNTLPDSMRGWAPHLIPDLSTWHTPRVVLVGDAAHAIPPHGGQGASQAFEDVGLLTRFLAEPEALKDGYEAVFERFEQLRKERFAYVKEVTKMAGDTRKTDVSPFQWTVKKWLMWAYFRVKGGSLSGDQFYSYDINDLPLISAESK